MIHPFLLDAVARDRMQDILRERAHDRGVREVTGAPTSARCARLRLPWYRQTIKVEVCLCGQTA